jgi:excinuclease UvrABC nuclease subunit
MYRSGMMVNEKETVKRFCVYHHTVNEKIVYIGKGSAVRPYFFSDRNDQWIKSVGDSKNITVSIVAWFDNEADALKEETRQIKLHKPIANKCFRPGGKTRVEYQKCRLSIRVEQSVIDWRK